MSSRPKTPRLHSHAVPEFRLRHLSVAGVPRHHGAPVEGCRGVCEGGAKNPKGGACGGLDGAAVPEGIIGVESAPVYPGRGEEPPGQGAAGLCAVGVKSGVGDGEGGAEERGRGSAGGCGGDAVVERGVCDCDGAVEEGCEGAAVPHGHAVREGAADDGHGGAVAGEDGPALDAVSAD